MTLLSYSLVLVDILSSIATAATGFGIVCAITWIICTVVWFSTPERAYDSEEERLTFKKIKNGAGWVFIAFIVIAILIPQKSTMHSVIAIEVANYTVTTPEAKEIRSIILDKVTTYLKDEKKESEKDD